MTKTVFEMNVLWLFPLYHKQTVDLDISLKISWEQATNFCWIIMGNTDLLMQVASGQH